MDEPKKRSKLRAKAGALCYGAARRLLWLKLEPSFATPPLWGGYTRHNRLVYDLEGRLLCEEPLAENHAVMMYFPYLEAPAE